MIVIETCPECGHDLKDLILCTYPPIQQKKCFNCGWSWEGKREEIIRVPFCGNTTNTTNTTETPSLNDHLNNINGFYPEASLVNNFEQSACITCSNNPKNGGSGICHCTLGSMQVTY